MRFPKIRLVLAAAAVVLLGLGFGSGSAMAATATPAGANTILSAGPVCSSPVAHLNSLYETCTSVSGSGLKINSVSGYTHAEAYTPEVHIEIYGPNGVLKNCAQVNVNTNSNGPTCTWTNPNPSANMPAGDYCAETWQLDKDGGYFGISECIGVHS